MLISVKKLAVSASGLITLMVMTVFAYQYLSEQERAQRQAPEEEDWTWTNPVTYQSVSLPPGWQATETGNTADTVVTLQHWTGRSVVYLVHEQSGIELSLREYVRARDDTIERELGIEDMEPAGNGGDVYQGAGGKLLGNEVAGTQVRVWRQNPREFWRGASIYDPEYKDLEYDADRIISLLRQTTASR